jgi:hypothetical protein
MPRRIATIEKSQRGLFDPDKPSVSLTSTQSARLATLVVALLLEIAVALATEEAGDEQNHR